MSDHGWIGVDLDGTLAYYDRWRGIEHIGEPVPLMLDRVKTWLDEGQEVKIFTARACEPVAVPFIEAWCEKHVGRRLEVTNVKDFRMVVLWDDRAIRVAANTGQVV
jgi:hypothetical protein